MLEILEKPERRSSDSSFTGAARTPSNGGLRAYLSMSSHITIHVFQEPIALYYPGLSQEMGSKQQSRLFVQLLTYWKMLFSRFAYLSVGFDH